MSTWTDERDAAIAHITAFFTSLKTRIVGLFDTGVNAIEKAITDNEAKIEGDAVAFFKDAATQSVTTAAVSTGTNTEKAELALITFFGILATKGIELGTNEAKLLLESAYANFKAAQA